MHRHRAVGNGRDNNALPLRGTCLTASNHLRGVECESGVPLPSHLQSENNGRNALQANRTLISPPVAPRALPQSPQPDGSSFRFLRVNACGLLASARNTWRGDCSQKYPILSSTGPGAPGERVLDKARPAQSAGPVRKSAGCAAARRIRAADREKQRAKSANRGYREGSVRGLAWTTPKQFRNIGAAFLSCQGEAASSPYFVNFVRVA